MTGPDDEPNYRCVRCGAEHERAHVNCPECGARFVAKIEDTERKDDVNEGS